MASGSCNGAHILVAAAYGQARPALPMASTSTACSLFLLFSPLQISIALRRWTSRRERRGKARYQITSRPGCWARTSRISFVDEHENKAGGIHACLLSERLTIAGSAGWPGKRQDDIPALIHTWGMQPMWKCRWRNKARNPTFEVNCFSLTPVRMHSHYTKKRGGGMFVLDRR